MSAPLSNQADNDKLGVLLVGHGTRRKSGQDQVRQLFERFAECIAPLPCELAFLELAEPDIPTAIQTLATEGVKQLVTVPVLLFSAGHALEDIPQAVEAAALQLGIEVLSQMKSLECHPQILKLSHRRFREAVCTSPVADYLKQSGHNACPAICIDRCLGNFCSQAGVLYIGRGSNSSSATEEMRRFARLRNEDAPAAWHETAFIHGQQPNVEAGLTQLAETGLPLAVVQPHLLFEGLLIEELRQRVADQQLKHPNQRWIITDTLGIDRALVDTLAALTHETIACQTTN